MADTPENTSRPWLTEAVAAAELQEPCDLPPEEPEDGDYVLFDSGCLGCKTTVCVVMSRPLGEYSSYDEALEAVKADMAENQYFPNVWCLSDHGNLSLLSSAEM